jgi:hypothetical protein
MANDNNKRLEDWKIASKKYCDLLEEMVTELRGKIEMVPATYALTALAKKSEVIQRAGQCFRDDVDRAVDRAPQPPSEYDFAAKKF